jgi:actin-like ATPase involved in cell morphogenesis
MGWTLVVDFGTTSTSAAIVDGVDIELLDLNGLSQMPSAVRREEGGGLVVGASADRAGWAPETVNRTPKRTIGEVQHVLLGGVAVEVVDAVAAVLRAVLEEGTRVRNGFLPDAALLTHPARWTEPECTAFVDAAARAGLPNPQLLPEPVAAAAHERDLAPNELLAVYDLGGTFATAVLRRTTSGYELLAHGGSADRGSEHLDDLLVAHVGKHVQRVRPDTWAALVAGETETWRRRATELRRDVRMAKESLSRHKRHIVHVSAAPCDVPITRDELEGVIRESVAATAAELTATIAQAGAVPDQVKRYCLVGGGSHIPMVTRLVAETAGVLPTAGSAPEKAVVLGAARVALADLAAATTTVIPVVTDTEPAATTTDGTATPEGNGEQPSDSRPTSETVARRPAGGSAATKRPLGKRTWRRPAVLLLVGAAAAAIVVATVTMVALRQGAPTEVVEAASAATARSTPAPSTIPPSAANDELGAAAPAAPSVTVTINGPSQVAVGDTNHYTAIYNHPELVASCRWTDATGKVVSGCGWLPVSFTDAASYTLRFTIVQTSGETHTVTKAITAA